jgi:hypothetical protein
MHIPKEELSSIALPVLNQTPRFPCYSSCTVLSHLHQICHTNQPSAPWSTFSFKNPPKTAMNRLHHQLSTSVWLKSKNQIQSCKQMKHTQNTKKNTIHQLLASTILDDEWPLHTLAPSASHLSPFKVLIVHPFTSTDKNFNTISASQYRVLTTFHKYLSIW